MVEEVSEESPCNEEALVKILQENPRLLVFVSNDMCGMCNYAEGAVAQAEEQVGSKVATLDLKLGPEPECEELARKLRIQGVPQVIYFENGQEKKRIIFSGNIDKDVKELTEMI